VRYLDGSREALRALVEVLRLLIGSTVEIGLPAAFEPLRLHIERVAREAEVAKLDGAGMLWNGLGYHLHDVADYAAARAASEQAVAIGEVVSGPRHPSVARDIDRLGSVLHQQGDLAGARAAHEEALTIIEPILGPAHPKVGAAVNNLGGVLKDLGESVEAQAHVERGLAIAEQAFGPEHPRVATSVANLGNVLYAAWYGGGAAS
jgi:tetratricopeptide (TPR) repeat protein